MKSKVEGPSVVDVRDVPAVDKGLLPPVELVKHWIAMFGNFKDGKIEKSRVMNKKDLTSGDAKYLLDIGINPKEIAVQYSMSDELLTSTLIKMKLLPVPMTTVKDDDAVWFSDTGLKILQTREPTIRFFKNNISFNSAFAKELDAEYIHIGVTTDNHIKIKPSTYGLKVQTNGGNRSKARRISCAPSRNLLIKQGVKIPATFRMTKDAAGCWIGVLIDESTC